jgi:hypothetical protein
MERGLNQLIPTSLLPYQEDLESLQKSVQVHIRPGSKMTPNNVLTWLTQKQYYRPKLKDEIKEGAMDVVVTGRMKQLYDYDINTAVESRDLTQAPRDFEFMYNVNPSFQKKNEHRSAGVHYNQIFDTPGHLKNDYETTMKKLFKRSFEAMLHACTEHYEATKSNGFTSFEFPVQMPHAFFDGFEGVKKVEIDGVSCEGIDIAKTIFAKALQEFLDGEELPPGCSGVTTIGFFDKSVSDKFAKFANHKLIRHTTANSLKYSDAAKKAGVQFLVPFMGDEGSRMMNGAFGDRAEHAAEENISRQTSGQPAMLLCPTINRFLAELLDKWCQRSK